jgi:NADPH2:quinone reductase
MRALVVDHTAPHHLRIAEAPDPHPTPRQAVIEVAAVSLNRGEIAFRAPNAPAGVVLGWDAAGVVARPAEDGSGPPAGTLVLTLDTDGAWAQFRAVDTDRVAVVPTGADPGALATLPVAATSALRALRRIGLILGQRVLVTGASGGVGRFAVQLAALSGAHIVALAAREHHADLRALGAAETIATTADLDAPVAAAIDVIGGETLTWAFDSLHDPDGILVSIGHASGDEARFAAPSLVGRQRTITGFYLFADTRRIAHDMTMLAGLLHQGRLDPAIAWRRNWEHSEQAITHLLNRELHGKAVLDVT